MAFDLGKLRADKGIVSPGSIGGRIRKLREYRGLTQKELGMRCGYTEGSAYTRISQYESNSRLPKPDALEAIAKALNVDVNAFYNADLISDESLFHVLFDIEDFHGLHPVKLGDHYYLEFSGDTVLGTSVSSMQYSDFLEEWYKMREKCYDPDTKQRNIQEYTLWRAGYPMNVSVERRRATQDKQKMAHLQAEMDSLYAKMNTEEMLRQIDDAMKPELNSLTSHKTILNETTLIELIYDVLQKGLPLLEHSPEVKLENDYSMIHLISIKASDLMDNTEYRKLFAQVLCALDDIKKSGISIIRKVTSLNKELYLTYEYPASQSRYFSNLQNAWGKMRYIIARKDTSADFVIAKLEQEFKDQISAGENIRFSKDK